MGEMSDDDQLPDDPCRAEGGASVGRALIFVLLFVILLNGGALTMLSDSFYVRLLSAALAYTASVMIYGFASNRNGIPRYLFTCPVVVSQYRRLLKRHALFLAVVIGFLAIVLRLFPQLEAGASRANDGSYFLVAIPLMVLAVTEIMTNRGVLDRAHNDRFGEPPSDGESEIDGTLSIFGKHE